MMDTSKLKKFAAFARRELKKDVGKQLKQVIMETSAARREQPQTVKALERAISQSGEEQLIERVAYIWFNRFCALRFMDVNRYTRMGVVSPAEGQFQPEILAEAKMGHIDDDLADAPTRAKILDLLSGKAPSSDPQTEAYRLLLVAACNDWHKAMPYLFEKINDYTELLMPDDLLSGSSILAYTREALTPEACQDVEVIGWLYQFYISEKKDEVFEGLKKNKKITPENIPAATQLFTPHWIVRYLVENSLGRLWMLNRPQSRLIEQMDYYIQPAEPETDFLKISSPEEIKICDPACGSGHMLTYAFDLLYAIYEESGYEPSDIPEKILTHNLYGIEIDERAGELAALALTMKARAKSKRFFRKPVQPNICVMENISLSTETLNNYARVFGKELFTDSVIETLHQFREAKNFGSLIIPKTGKSLATLTALQKLQARSLVGKGSADELPPEKQLLVSTPNFDAICTALQQADYLSSKYHVMIANPPYMGSKGMNGTLSEWAKKEFSDSKSDLFAMFMERGLDLILPKAYSAMVTMESWMFLTSFEKLRTKLLSESTINSLVHMPYLGKGNTSMGINFGTVAFVSRKSKHEDLLGTYICVRHFECNDEGIPMKFPPVNDRLRTSRPSEFEVIPGKSIAYWLSPEIKKSFRSKLKVYDLTISDGQTKTGDNEKFLRMLWEIDKNSIGPGNHWCLHPKGGSYRKWFGNVEWVIDWSQQAREHYRNDRVARILPEYLWYKPGVLWTDFTSGENSFRILEEGQIFNLRAAALFVKDEGDQIPLSSLLNSTVSKTILKAINPTMMLNVGDVRSLPVVDGFSDLKHRATTTGKRCIQLAKIDWDSYETSWDFSRFPLLNPDYHKPTLFDTYYAIRSHWQKVTLEMKILEEENNDFFNKAYGLEAELEKAVSIEDITLTCNPFYRYGSNKTETELESLLLGDTIKELISYSVGCMFGRYALEKPGLILSNLGETLEDYLAQIPNPSFPADKDNVIPILEGDWFSDDITERFRKFLRLTFGEEHYAENLKFIEDSIGKDLRKYFLKDFYADHVKRYKKRPIYWLFSSPKGSFNALIYMHRYQPDTVSIVLNDYLREFKTKLSARLEHLKRIEANVDANKAEKAKSLKEIENLRKIIEELDGWERDVMYPLATDKIAIDLDDGVKVNYTKFGAALKKIPGLEAKDED